MSLKKILAVLAAGSVTLGLASCSDSEGGSAAGGGSDGDNYVFAKGSEPQNPLIPANTNEVGGGNIIDLIYSGWSTTTTMVRSTTKSQNRSSWRGTRRTGSH